MTTPLRVLVVLEAGDAWPSGVVRGLVYRELFAQHGFQVEYVSRRWPTLVRLMEGRAPRLAPLLELGLSGLLERLHYRLTPLRERYIVVRASRTDVVYMSKVLSVSLIRRLRERTRARLVLDFGDAVWQRGAADRFREVMGLVDAVTTDNEYTAAYVRPWNPACTAISDTPPLQAFDRRRALSARGRDGRVVLGWVGTPATAHSLFVVWEALERLFARHPALHLRLVGVGHRPEMLPPFSAVRFSVRPYYTEAEMVEEVLGMDIGLFPLHDVEAAQVRGVLKATVYMAGEAAVVCSPRGQCVDLVKDGVNGMLADSTEEWERKLEDLITDPMLRRRIAAAGLDTVRTGFTVEQAFAQLRGVLLGNGAENR